MKGHTILPLLIVPFVFLACASPEKSYHNATSRAPYDVIIVPGIPYQGDDWTKNPTLENRVLWSLFLIKNGVARNVIYSGNAVYTPYTEAKIMGLYARALGIPPAKIYAETHAEHSTENLVYGYRMARKLGFVKIAVATDPFQANTLRSYAWNYGLEVDFIPIIYDSLKQFQGDSSIRIDPSEAKVDNFVALPDRENYLTRFLGTLGLRIDEDKDK
jgi:uncharacterized SAM-binding protein YcdF (DUF218 family)